MDFAAVGIVLITGVAVAVAVYVLAVQVYWCVTDDPAAPVGTVRTEDR